MQDTVIKGEGTSRSLKIPASKAVVYQDVSAMVQDMVSGNFLFDLGPIRLEGVTQKGMDLNKANLLTDATAALYGKGSNASPDEILAAIKTLIQTAQNTANNANTNANSRVKVETGYRHPTGTTKFTLNFSINPKIVLFQAGNGWPGIAIRSSSIVYVPVYGNAYYCNISWGSSSMSLTWSESVNLYYAAIGT